MFGHNSQATIDRISSESVGWKEACSDAYDLIQQLQYLAKENGIEIPNDLDLNYKSKQPLFPFLYSP